MFGAVRNKLLFVLWYKYVSEPDLRTGLCDGIYICKQRRMEATFKRGQDSYRIVEPMMMMMYVYPY
jgi:hypothetical protein